VFKERMEELDRVEEYFRLVNEGAIDGSVQDSKYTDVQTTQDGDEFEVEVTTSLSLPSS
jgi:hypothetical protein